MLSFSVNDASGAELFAAQQTFDNHSTTYFLWDDADRVWVYSGDIGTYFWEYNSGESELWVQKTYVKETVPAPDFLKEVRGKYHPR